MLRKHLVLLIACLALFVASCSTGGDDDSDADGGGGQTTTEAPANGEDEDGEGEDDDDETTSTTIDEDDDEGNGSGGGGDGSRQAYVDAMARSILADDDTMPLDAAQAECLSESWIDIVDHERLAAAGITPEDIAADEAESPMNDIEFSEDDANGLVDSFGNCDIDVTEMFIQSFEQHQALAPEDRACLENAFNEDFMRRIFVLTLTQGDEAIEEDPELMGQMMGALFACPGAMGLSEGDLSGDLFTD